jgi:hypothetical protein
VSCRDVKAALSEAEQKRLLDLDDLRHRAVRSAPMLADRRGANRWADPVDGVVGGASSGSAPLEFR